MRSYDTPISPSAASAANAALPGLQYSCIAFGIIAVASLRVPSTRSAEGEMDQRGRRPGQVELRERNPHRIGLAHQPQMCARESHGAAADSDALTAERGVRDVGAEVEI